MQPQAQKGLQASWLQDSWPRSILRNEVDILKNKVLGHLRLQGAGPMRGYCGPSRIIKEAQQHLRLCRLSL
jgi:hypothetical protein